MTDERQKQILANNLNYFLSVNGKQQNEVAKAIGEKTTTFNTWCKGKAMPSVGKIQKIADYFGVGKSALTDEHPINNPNDMYLSICHHIQKCDPRFANIIKDYFLMTKDEKELICDFFETFVTKNRGEADVSIAQPTSTSPRKDYI